MNLIVIVSDTLRRDYLGCYGNDWVKTPHIDALAVESVIFDACYVGSFPTIPMRADVMTGKYVFHNVGWAPLQPGYVPFQNLLRRTGYVTAMIADRTQFLAPGMNYHQGLSGNSTQATWRPSGTSNLERLASRWFSGRSVAT